MKKITILLCSIFLLTSCGSRNINETKSSIITEMKVEKSIEEKEVEKWDVLKKNEWKTLTHKNFWNNKDFFGHGDYNFANIKFSYPGNWDKLVALDTDSFSWHRFYDNTKKNGFEIKVHYWFNCEKIYTRCEDFVYRTGNEKLELFLNDRKEKWTQFWEFYLSGLNKSVYISWDKIQYIFEIDGDIVEFEFYFENQNIDIEFINKVLTSISHDVNNDIDTWYIKDFWNGIIVEQDKYHTYVYFNDISIFQSTKDIYFEKNEESIENISILTKYNISDAGFQSWNIILNHVNKTYFILDEAYISKISMGKSGIYYIVGWENWYSDLRMIDSLWNNKSLFKWSSDNWDETIIIYDYQLMLNQKIKVLYYHWLGKSKNEKIVELN